MSPRLAPRRAMEPTSECVLRPVVALDIDGTLGYYHEHFARFASAYLQRDIPASWEGNVPFWRHCCGSKTTYRQMKLAYRQGAQKRSMPVVPGAAELTRVVRRAGAEVWVCTTRPYLRLDNIDPDTRFWLRHNGIQFDGVLFGESKYRDLATLVGSGRVVAVLDDEPEQVRRAEAAKLPGWLMEREYNKQFLGCPRIFSLEQASSYFSALVKKWRKNEGV